MEKVSKMKASIFLVFVLAFSVFSLGCLSGKTENTATFTPSKHIEVTDMAGKTVILNHIPKRAVFLAGESWIYALGSIKDRVIGVSRWACTNLIIPRLDSFRGFTALT